MYKLYAQKLPTTSLPVWWKRYKNKQKIITNRQAKMQKTCMSCLATSNEGPRAFIILKKIRLSALDELFVTVTCRQHLLLAKMANKRRLTAFFFSIADDAKPKEKLVTVTLKNWRHVKSFHSSNARKNSRHVNMLTREQSVFSRVHTTAEDRRLLFLQAWAHEIFIFRTENIRNFRTFFRTSESQKRVFLSFRAHITSECLELRLK